MRRINDIRKYFDNEIKLIPYSVLQDSFDIKNFKEIREKNHKIKHTYEHNIVDYPPYEYLQHDLFSSLYKYSPKLTADTQLKAKSLLNKSIIASIIKSPKYKELRNLTRLDLMSASIGTEVLDAQVTKLIEELKDDFKELLEQFQEIENSVQEKLSEENNPKEDNNESSKQINKQLTLEEAQEKLEEAYDNIENTVKESLKNVNVSKMLSTTLEETKKVSDMISAWGLEKDPDFISQSYEQKLELLSRLRTSPALKKISDLAGKMKRLAFNAQHEKIKRGADEIHTLVQGGDFSKLVPSETMKLKHPILKKLFKKELTEKKLLQYDYYSKEKKARGPIICCIDSSGSMHGDPEIWSKAVALALLDIARMQNRNFHAIHFSYGMYGSHNDLHTNTFLKGQNNIKETLDLASYFIGGGTNFEIPLIEAQKLINEDKNFSKADILFISDGEAPVRNSWVQEFNKWKKEKNVSVYSILINNYYGSKSSLKLFSDQIDTLNNIKDYNKETISGIFSKF